MARTIRETDNGIIQFTDGSYLHLGRWLYVIDGTGMPDYGYYTNIGGYNPSTGEWTQTGLPCICCIRDNTTGDKIAGFTGEKTDVNGYTWIFSLNGLQIKKDDVVIFNKNIAANVNAYAVGYNPRDRKYYLYEFTIPYYDDAAACIFRGLDGIAGGGTAGTVYQDYFKDSNTFYNTSKTSGVFYNINSNPTENTFVKVSCVLALKTAAGGSANSYLFINSSVITSISDYTPVPITEADPYSPGGTTQPGGGNGSFNPSGDAISTPSLPTLTALSTGFISMWRPSAAEMTQLFNYLWSAAFDLNSFKKIFANPIDAIMSFGIIPLNPVVGATKTLNIGNIATTVNLTPITQQYYQLDCGTLYLDNIFNTYLEFEPYSSLEIFLPFVGCMPLSSDDFYRRKEEYPGGGKINVKYNIDILSGACVACLSCYNATGETTMTYEFNGNVLTQLPITGNDFTGMYNSLIGIAGNVISGVSHAATGNAAGILGDVVNAAHNVTSAKPTINRSGTIGGAYGLLANRKPYLIRNIPRDAVATLQNIYEGYPSHVTKGVASLSDYTEFEVVYLHNVPASDPELKEIEELLKTGVIL